MRPNTARFIFVRGTLLEAGRIRPHSDRKSTRLNSSHDQISYAVFCLKKKKQHNHARKACGVEQRANAPRRFRMSSTGPARDKGRARLRARLLTTMMLLTAERTGRGLY